MTKKKIISSIIFIAITVFITLSFSRILSDKMSERRKTEFFNAKTGFDALYFGTSRVREGVDPMYIWENYGIASYNLASPGESIQVTYYVLSEALEHCDPKVVFIDSAKISDDFDEINSGYGFVHESIDALPLNRNKLDAISYASRFFDGGRLAFLSMLYAYHDRYEALDKNDFVLNPNYDKGAYIMTSVYGGEKPVHLTDEAMELKGGDGVRYYKKILELCSDRGIKCVLVDIPTTKDGYSLDKQKKLNALIKLTRDNGGDSIAFNNFIDELDIDYDHCFGDTGHLNFIGSAKVNDYLSSYMQNELGIADHRNDPSYSTAWNEDMEKLNKSRIDSLSEKIDAVEYMFGASYLDPEITLYINNMDNLYKQYAMDYCLEKLNIEPETADEEILGGYDMKIEVRDKSGTFLGAQFFKFNYSSGLFTAPLAEADTL